MKLHKEKNDSDTSQVILDRNQKPVPPVPRIMSIFALYNVNKHSMPRQKREKSGTGTFHVMQGQESKNPLFNLIKPLLRQ